MDDLITPDWLAGNRADVVVLESTKYLPNENKDGHAAFLAAHWTRFLAGLAILALTQVTGLFALHALAVAGLVAQVRDVRAWAVAVPVLIFATVVTRARAAGHLHQHDD